MRFGRPHQQAYDIQQNLIGHMNSITCKAGEAAQLARAWVELEWFKRELRGLPRLKSAELMATLKRLPNAQRTTDAAAPIELSDEPQPTKESIKHSFSETVATPPPSDAPASGQ